MPSSEKEAADRADGEQKEKLQQPPDKLPYFSPLPVERKNSLPSSAFSKGREEKARKMQERWECENGTWKNLGELTQNLRKTTAKMRDRNSQTAPNEVQKLSVVFTTIAQNFVLKCSTKHNTVQSQHMF